VTAYVASSMVSVTMKGMMLVSGKSTALCDIWNKGVNTVSKVMSYQSIFRRDMLILSMVASLRYVKICQLLRR
jgi:hypothetical protein